MAPETIHRMLKRHRKSLGWTQQQLADALCQEAGRATLTRQEIYRWENGRRVPTFWLPHLMSVLGITRDELERVISPSMNEDDRDRIAHSLAAPSRVDAGTVAALTDVLPAQRRLDDSLPATTMLPATAAQWESVEQLAREARGPHADALRYVAAEYVQFLGWLHAEARNDRDAVRYLTEAEERADDLDDGPLVAQAANFKGYLARQQGRPRAVVRWFSAAYHTPGAAPLQRVGDAVQAAHGTRFLGNVRRPGGCWGMHPTLPTKRRTRRHRIPPIGCLPLFPVWYGPCPPCVRGSRRGSGQPPGWTGRSAPGTTGRGMDS